MKRALNGAEPAPVSAMFDVVTVRELSVRIRADVVAETVTRQPVTSPQAARELVESMIRQEAVECFAVVLLNVRNHPVGVHLLSRGLTAAAPVCPREVFRLAVIESCVAVVVAHNHPSGDPTPSYDDRMVTERLRQAGEIIGIAVLDHLIVTPQGRTYSFANEGELKEGA